MPFEGICLTDTFQLYEKDDLVSALLVDNSARRVRQKALDIRVIIGNPPYSVGQNDANDNNANVEYPFLDGRIRETYAAQSVAANSRNLYDSYIRAIRWASDRIGDSGIVGFVTNAGFIASNTADGLRKCLSDEFSSLYVFHLRGNQRTSGDLSRREGGKIFGSGSRAPIAISLLVKNPNASQRGQIHFHDIGDYLSREDKLARIRNFVSVAGITQADGWTRVVPDQHGDWLGQRDDSFANHIPLGDRKGGGPRLFDNFSLGVTTNRDAWCYNASKQILSNNLDRMIEFYNAELDRLNAEHSDADKKSREILIDDFINTDRTKISWSRSLKANLAKAKRFAFDSGCLVKSSYRPFYKNWLYFSKDFNELIYKMPQIFPTQALQNLVICSPGNGERRGFSTIMVNSVIDLNSMDGGTQCFPLYLYDLIESEATPKSATFRDLFDAPASEPEATSAEKYRRRDAITDEGLDHFQAAYPGVTIGKEDIFYYVYGLLHSPDYRQRFADNLSKELPRIPRVKKVEDFWAFAEAGRTLADLHVDYENVIPYPATITGEGDGISYRVEKMHYGGKGGKDKSILHYNDRITVTSIPLEAYEYVVNGKPALDWVVERQCVKPDKDSGIVNDANDWAVETMGNPRYPLELFLRVITVSLETMKIVKALPPLDID